MFFIWFDKETVVVKAHVYVVSRGALRQAYLSIAQEADERFWSNAVFRKGVLAGWGRAVDSFVGNGGPAQLAWLPEPVPLGIAVRVRERLELAAGECRSNLDLQAEIRAAVNWANEQCGARVRLEDGDECGYETDESGRRLPAWLKHSELEAIGRRLGRLARQLAEKLRGRQLLEAEAACLVPDHANVPLHVLLQIAYLMGEVQLVSGVAPIGEAIPIGRGDGGKRGWSRRTRNVQLRCRRCGSGEARREGHEDGGTGIRRTPCASCGRMQCAYCETCLTMGRSRECGLLVIGQPSVSRLTFPHPADHYLDGWGLSAPQREAAGAAVSYLLNGEQCAQRRGILSQIFSLSSLFHARSKSRPAAGSAPASIPPNARSHFARQSPYERTFLLWAVTGAGKTEMLFPLLQAVLSAGGRAAVAAPRRDVVLELAPRLAKAFPQASLAVLYGGSPDRFETGALTLATTHQLIRFKEAFDLVVIDEVDAFPYHNDPMLQFAGANARSARGVMVLLSATPPASMQKEVRRSRLPSARVPVRYHGRPLPIPKRLHLPPLSRWAHRLTVPVQLAAAISRSIGRGAQVFLFVPYIRQVEPLVRCLRENAGKLGIEPGLINGTSSQDPERGSKVMAFRARDIRLLVTTTILERGVTIPMSDVFVLDADKPLFDAASLVQMAGRAGRSADDPEGLVYFAAPAWTSSQREARSQIREMNAFARKKGYLVI